MAFVPTALPTLRRAHPPATCVRMGAADGGNAPVSRAAFLRLAAVAGVSAAVSAAGVPAASAFSIPNPFGGGGDAEKPAKTVGGYVSIRFSQGLQTSDDSFGADTSSIFAVER